MRQQFAAQRMFSEPPRESAVNSDSGMSDFGNLLLLAIERALAPPVVHRRTVFQPMRIVVIDPALLSQAIPDDEAQFDMPKVLPRALPPVADVPNFRAAQFHQRAVRGEILSDESGRLYERLGQQIRPIHRLASSQFGEAVDLVPNPPVPTRMIPPAPGPRAVRASVKTRAQSGSEEAATEKGDSGKSEFVPLGQTQTPQTAAVSHRKLFADPGQWRVVWWGEFKEILGRQLAHPERLQDTYRLPCYVQVLETERTVAIEELATVYKSNNEHHARLYFLTDEIAAKLDLVLPLRPAPPHHARREPNTLLAHERVFRLLAANDPTIDVTMSKSTVRSSTAKAASSGAIAKVGDPAAPTARLKDSIPNRFLKEWEFKLTREEASYEMKAEPALGSRIRRLWRRLRVLKQGKEFRKWQTLLVGRSIDEQLWAVRPPAGMLADPFVREWATKTLQHGGYDSEKMNIEWEIFWRRRGH